MQFSKDLSVFAELTDGSGRGEWKTVSVYFAEFKRAGFMGNVLKPASIWALRINRRSLSTGLSTLLVESLRTSCNH
jgi:hypothetical protein